MPPRQIISEESEKHLRGIEFFFPTLFPKSGRSDRKIAAYMLLWDASHNEFRFPHKYISSICHIGPKTLPEWVKLFSSIGLLPLRDQIKQILEKQPKRLVKPCTTQAIFHSLVSDGLLQYEQGTPFITLKPPHDNFTSLQRPIQQNLPKLLKIVHSRTDSTCRCSGSFSSTGFKHLLKAQIFPFIPCLPPSKLRNVLLSPWHCFLAGLGLCHFISELFYMYTTHPASFPVDIFPFIESIDISALPILPPLKLITSLFSMLLLEYEEASLVQSNFLLPRHISRDNIGAHSLDVSQFSDPNLRMLYFLHYRSVIPISLYSPTIHLSLPERDKPKTIQNYVLDTAIHDPPSLPHVPDSASSRLQDYIEISPSNPLIDQDILAHTRQGTFMSGLCMFIDKQDQFLQPGYASSPPNNLEDYNPMSGRVSQPQDASDKDISPPSVLPTYIDLPTHNIRMFITRRLILPTGEIGLCMTGIIRTYPDGIPGDKRKGRTDKEKKSIKDLDKERVRGRNWEDQFIGWDDDSDEDESTIITENIIIRTSWKEWERIETMFNSSSHPHAGHSPSTHSNDSPDHYSHSSPTSGSHISGSSHLSRSFIDESTDLHSSTSHLPFPPSFDHSDIPQAPASPFDTMTCKDKAKRIDDVVNVAEEEDDMEHEEEEVEDHPHGLLSRPILQTSGIPASTPLMAEMSASFDHTPRDHSSTLANTLSTSYSSSLTSVASNPPSFTPSSVAVCVYLLILRLICRTRSDHSHFARNIVLLLPSSYSTFFHHFTTSALSLLTSCGVINSCRCIFIPVSQSFGMFGSKYPMGSMVNGMLSSEAGELDRVNEIYKFEERKRLERIETPHLPSTISAFREKEYLSREKEESSRASYHFSDYSSINSESLYLAPDSDGLDKETRERGPGCFLRCRYDSTVPSLFDSALLLSDLGEFTSVIDQSTVDEIFTAILDHFNCDTAAQLYNFWEHTTQQCINRQSNRYKYLHAPSKSDKSIKVERKNQDGKWFVECSTDDLSMDFPLHSSYKCPTIRSTASAFSGASDIFRHRRDTPYSKDQRMEFCEDMDSIFRVYDEDISARMFCISMKRHKSKKKTAKPRISGDIEQSESDIDGDSDYTKPFSNYDVLVRHSFIQPKVSLQTVQDRTLNAEIDQKLAMFDIVEDDIHVTAPNSLITYDISFSNLSLPPQISIRPFHDGVVIIPFPSKVLPLIPKDVQLMKYFGDAINPLHLKSYTKFIISKLPYPLKKMYFSMDPFWTETGPDYLQASSTYSHINRNYMTELTLRSIFGDKIMNEIFSKCPNIFQMYHTYFSLHEIQPK
ncbi:hypothetical protein ADUPG1_012374 [Aduncisulcus paluster]|uniref:Uncharacterized protein n=1 Tax=Aduncisulcus paluster TaxID=2918883 RepID=A0ABQ5K148_9EUKA|nr:hypothetical protein ADUPG1_012374 [Aduncisulcus paluster]